MVRVTAFAATALGFLPLALGSNTLGATCTGGALGYLACYRRLPPFCVAEVASQASAFCSSYLSVPTTSTVTDTTLVTATAVNFNTIQTTVVLTSTLISVTTTTETSTSITASSTTTTVATSFVPPPLVSLRRRDYRSACPDLSNKGLARRPASKLSSVCSCLGITAPTVTTTATAFATSAESTTSTTTSATTTTTLVTSVSTTTTTTSTTTTSTVVASETAVVDYCSISYDGGGVTPGNTVVRPAGDLDGPQCCALCWSTPNCVASATGLGYCQLLVKTSPLEGAPTSLQCPLGIENYTYLPGPGTLYRGPCSPGLN